MKKILLAATCFMYMLTCHANMPKIESREHKVLLNADNFSPNIELAVRKLSKQLASYLSVNGIKLTSQKLTFDNSRTKSYWDTANHDLAKNHFILRTQSEPDGTNECILKYRDGDIFKSHYTAIKTSYHNKTTKFEQDITPLQSAYSYSVKAKDCKQYQFDTIRNIIEAFPSVEKLDIKKNTAVELVSAISISESQYKGLNIKKNKYKINLEVNLWQIDNNTKVDLAEVSYTVKDSSGKFDKEIIEFTKQLDNLLVNFKSWVSEHQSTKTQFVYNYNSLGY